MASKQFDVGLAVLPIHHPAVVCGPFIDTDVMAVLPAGHPLARRDELSVADLTDKTLITLPSYTVFRQSLDAAYAAEGLSPEARIETLSLYNACRMVAHGFGVCFADRFTVDCFLHERVEVRALQPPWRQTFGFVFPSDRPPSHLAVRFAEIVTATATRLVERDVAGAGQT